MATRRRVFIHEALSAPEETKKVSRSGYSPSDSRVLMNFSNAKEQFYQIDKHMLLPGTVIDFSIFKQTGLQFSLLLEASYTSPVTLSNEMLLFFSGDSGSEILIEKTATFRYQAYLNDLLAFSSSMPEDVKNARKSIAMKENTKIVMNDFLDNATSSEKLNGVKEAVVSIVDLLCDNTAAIYDMLTLSKFDYYTYTHCVNVAVLSVGLGLAAGLSKAAVADMGTGAMLHDVGKTTVSPLILNKQGRLNAHEYKTMQGHVRQGGAILREHDGISETVFDAMFQHHEKLSGRGYPFKLRGHEISLSGRICGIADCYDALTTNRPYRTALTPYNALDVISKDVGDYDADLLVDFVKMLGRIK
ncbi:MAG TPA: HD domain-containing phosphohydrolase [Dissulfurispiraceae bacterium]|nr:HD domain-containing phosphohydrolase [Dissulfurispiraceae bacterium]